jgi:serine protease AprX
MKLAGLIGCAIIFVVVASYGGVKTTPRLAETLRATPAQGPVMLWVFFTDKGNRGLQRASQPLEVVTQRSLDRRAKVRPADQLIDETDLPLEPSYVAAVVPLVLTIRQSSKWFNGVSVMATPEQIPAIEALPFVRGIDLVYRQGRPGDRERLEQAVAAPPTPLSRTNASNSLDYGPSFAQVSLENIPAVHDSGNSAQGIIIGVFDNGFRLLAHQAFDSLRSRIIGTYDFVDHKVSVIPLNPDIVNFGRHGINTLSTLAGYYPGNIIGPAYGASFILARTENDSVLDSPIEEDNWIRAIEWADSLGVQVTSTSLGYLTHIPPYPDWTWQDMDGNTTLITKAADLAVGKGIIVVNSAGNDRFDRAGLPNTLNAPADGDSVLTVGAVNHDGSIAYFSSYGPTSDGRIKPDLVAQGTSIYVADVFSSTSIGFMQGTSFSCPLAAGVAALALKSHPLATPMQIVNAMKKSASRAATPNNDYGWGIVNAVRTIAYLNGDTLPPPPPGLPQSYALGQNYPNPFNPGTKIEFLLPEAASITLKVYDVLGREVRVILEGAYSPTSTTPFQAIWDGTDNAGRRMSSGVYFYRLQAKGVSGNSFTQVRKMMMVR